MDLFWPCAIRVNERGEEEPLFTYDSCLSEREALKVIDCWIYDYGFKLAKAWIDRYNGNSLVKKIRVLPCNTIDGGKT